MFDLSTVKDEHLGDGEEIYLSGEIAQKFRQIAKFDKEFRGCGEFGTDENYWYIEGDTIKSEKGLGYDIVIESDGKVKMVFDGNFLT